jgi:hypothetical protein
VAVGLEEPVHVAAPWGDPRLFVVEHAGRIRVVDPVAGAVAGDFLDLRARVGAAGEQGLWGLAFPPDYAETGHFYVLYQSARGETVISRFVAPDPASGAADPSSEHELLRIGGVGTDRLTGSLQFGPADGMLYAGVATPSAATQWEAQSLSTLRGKLLRIDVRGGPRDLYAIPADNPFAGAGAPVRREIWAIGLRHPARFDFDPATGEMWIGERGPNREEIDLQPAGAGGLNYGWPVHEGSTCRQNRPELGLLCEDPAAPSQFRFPVVEYAHGAGCAVVGGAPYRGAARWFGGLYFYGDACRSGFGVHARRPRGGLRDWWIAEASEDGEELGDLTALGRDGFGELYAVGGEKGRVVRLLAGSDQDRDGVLDGLDNCRFASNRDQADADGDALGDACDPDFEEPV